MKLSLQFNDDELDRFEDAVMGTAYREALENLIAWLDEIPDDKVETDAVLNKIVVLRSDLRADGRS